MPPTRSTTSLMMLRRRAAAAADDVCAEILCKMFDLSGKALGRLVIILLAVLDLGQTGVRQDGNRQRRILAEITKAVGHVLRPGAAVHPDHVDRKWFERRQRRADLRTVQHRAEYLDRDLCDDRNPDLVLFKELKDRCNAAFVCRRSWHVSTMNRSAPPSNKAANLFAIRIFQIAICYVTKCRKFCSRTHRARNKSRFDPASNNHLRAALPTPPRVWFTS